MLTRMRILVSLSLLWGSLLGATVADAQEAMAFTFTQEDYRSQGFGLRQTVYADGVITPGTAVRLQAFLDAHKVIPGSTVEFNSPGGNLAEGMRIGRLIRKRGLSTDVGQQNSERKMSGCFSACTLAFLGGEQRYFPSSRAQFGVHRFYVPGNTMSGDEALDVSQTQSGEISEYVNFMGVKPGFISEINKASAQQMNILSQDVMFDLGILTKDYKTEWEIKIKEDGQFYLRGITKDVRGEHKIIFDCPAEFRKQPIILFIYDADDAKAIVDTTAFLQLRVDKRGIDLSKNDVLSKTRAEGGQVWTIISLNQKILEYLRDAKELGFAMLPPSRELYVGFDGEFVEGRRKLFDYLKSCH